VDARSIYFIRAGFFLLNRTIFGTAIKTYLHNPRLKTIVNIILSLSLVYTAVVLTGIL
jgi:hypothetical protein